MTTKIDDMVTLAEGLLRPFARDEATKHGHLILTRINEGGEKGLTLENKGVALASMTFSAIHHGVVQLHSAWDDGHDDYEMAATVETNWMWEVDTSHLGVIALAVLRMAWLKDDDTPVHLGEEVVNMLRACELSANLWHQ